MKLYAYDHIKNKDVYAGKYDTTEKIFAKVVVNSHYIDKTEGFSIKEETIEQLKEMGCEKVWIINIANGAIRYESAFKDWLDKQAKDYGNGMIRFLKLDEMRIPTQEETRMTHYEY